MSSPEGRADTTFHGECKRLDRPRHSEGKVMGSFTCGFRRVARRDGFDEFLVACAGAARARP
jgi:hypothetical protein